MKFNRPEEAAIWCSFAEKAITGAVVVPIAEEFPDEDDRSCITAAAASIADMLLEQYRLRRSDAHTLVPAEHSEQ